jgi:hypothetical protein
MPVLWHNANLGRHVSARDLGSIERVTTLGTAGANSWTTASAS